MDTNFLDADCAESLATEFPEGNEVGWRGHQDIRVAGHQGTRGSGN